MIGKLVMLSVLIGTLGYLTGLIRGGLTVFRGWTLVNKLAWAGVILAVLVFGVFFQ